MKSSGSALQGATTGAAKPLRWKRWLLMAFALPVFTVAAVLGYELYREHFPRLDLPAFDHAKAKALTPENRAAYEQELFSELQLSEGPVAFVPVQPATPDQERRQSVAAMVNGANTASTLGGDAGLIPGWGQATAIDPLREPASKAIGFKMTRGE